MTWLTPLISAIHWLSVGIYCGSLLFFLLIFGKSYERYRAYRYIDNFRGEIVQNFWKLLHVTFVLIVLSGAALAGLNGKPLLRGVYGLIFSSKLALWLLQLYLLMDLLKPFLPESYNDDTSARTSEREWRSMGAIILLFLIAAGGFVLKYLP